MFNNVSSITHSITNWTLNTVKSTCTPFWISFFRVTNRHTPGPVLGCDSSFAEESSLLVLIALLFFFLFYPLHKTSFSLGMTTAAKQ
jgi:hypothetical protein